MIRALNLGVRGLATISKSTPELSRITPMNFVGVNLKYGWVLIPKAHYAYRWTKEELTQIIENKYNPTDLDKPDISEIQNLVDEWIANVDLLEKPKNQKLTRADVKKIKEDTLYRSQLRDDQTSAPEQKTKSATGQKKTERTSSITFIHAWNYFYSITHPKYAHLGKTDARREVASVWNAMTSSEKDVYRTKYSKLIDSGKDVFKGKIIDRQKKLEMSAKIKASKRK